MTTYLHTDFFPTIGAPPGVTDDGIMAQIPIQARNGVEREPEAEEVENMIQEYT